ncbi:MAG TPA: hypothetical protein ENH79_03615 [Pseudoalteromonas sp.]|nr:hypothetical protein [Pseudoalteromonas sp.]
MHYNVVKSFLFTTAWMQEVEQCREQLPRTTIYKNFCLGRVDLSWVNLQQYVWFLGKAEPM